MAFKAESFIAGTPRNLNKQSIFFIITHFCEKAPDVELNLVEREFLKLQTLSIIPFTAAGDVCQRI